MTAGQKLAGVLVLMGIACFSTWKVDAWRYGKQLADLKLFHQSDLTTISNAANAQARAEQEKRLDLEARLAVSDHAIYQVKTNAQKEQVRLRDRIATADVRLSVLLDATDSASGCNVPTTPGAGSVVHGRVRAKLDPAHAQRIIGITGDGDQGLIALRACQVYAKEVSTAK